MSDVEGLRKAARRIFYEAKQIEAGKDREREILLEALSHVYPYWYELMVVSTDLELNPEATAATVMKCRRAVDGMRQVLEPCDGLVDAWNKAQEEK
jgi:hypothetical protein